MSVKQVWILNLAIVVVIVVLASYVELTDEYQPELKSNYEVLLENQTGIDEKWLPVFALVFVFCTVPFIIKIVWNGFLTKLPNIPEIKYAHAVLIILIITLLAGW